MPGTVVPFPESASATISDLVQDADAFKPHCLNLIAAGCGAGKSYFVAERIASLFPDVAPCDILICYKPYTHGGSAGERVPPRSRKIQP